MKKEAPKSFEKDDLVAWASQAAGGWKTKIGRLLEAADPAVSAPFVVAERLASYRGVTFNAKVSPMRVHDAKKLQKYRPRATALRKPTAAELKAAEL